MYAIFYVTKLLWGNFVQYIAKFRLSNWESGVSKPLWIGPNFDLSYIKVRKPVYINNSTMFGR